MLIYYNICIHIMCTITGPIILFTTLTTHIMLQMIHIKGSQLRKVFFAYSKTNLLWACLPY